MKSQNKTQHTNIPWLHNSLNQFQYEELFDLSSQMKQKFNKELYNYLSKMLDQPIMEKLSLNNSIDTLIESMISNNGYDKYCSNCNKKGIENWKQACLKCRSRLPTLSEL